MSFIVEHPASLLVFYIGGLAVLEFLLARRHSFGGGVIPVALLLNWIVLNQTSSEESKAVFATRSGFLLLVLPIIVTGVIYLVCRLLARKGFFPPKESKITASFRKKTRPHDGYHL